MEVLTQESFSDQDVIQIKSLVDEVRDRMSSFRTLEEVTFDPPKFSPRQPQASSDLKIEQIASSIEQSKQEFFLKLQQQEQQVREEQPSVSSESKVSRQSRQLVAQQSRQTITKEVLNSPERRAWFHKYQHLSNLQRRKKKCLEISQENQRIYERLRDIKPHNEIQTVKQTTRDLIGSQSFNTNRTINIAQFLKPPSDSTRPTTTSSTYCFKRASTQRKKSDCISIADYLNRIHTLPQLKQQDSLTYRPPTSMTNFSRNMLLSHPSFQVTLPPPDLRLEEFLQTQEKRRQKFKELKSSLEPRILAKSVSNVQQAQKKFVDSVTVKVTVQGKQQSGEVYSSKGHTLVQGYEKFVRRMPPGM